MNRKLVTLFAVLLALSMALSACAAPGGNGKTGIIQPRGTTGYSEKEERRPARVFTWQGGACFRL